MVLIRLAKSVYHCRKVKDKIPLVYRAMVTVRKDPNGLRFQIRAITFCTFVLRCWCWWLEIYVYNI